MMYLQKLINNEEYGMILFYFGSERYIELFNEYKSKGLDDKCEEMIKVSQIHLNVRNLEDNR